MYGDHWRWNTVGGHSDSLQMITPPTPWLEVLTTLTKSSHLAMSPGQCVGQLVDSQRIVLQLKIAKQRGHFEGSIPPKGIAVLQQMVARRY